MSHLLRPHGRHGPSHFASPPRARRPLLVSLVTAVLAAGLVAGCGSDGGDASVLDANPDSAATAWNTPVTVDVLANDTSNEGPVTVAAVSKPAHGTARMVDGKLVYTPDAGWFGTETFSYTASGASIRTDVAVTVAVQARMTLSGTVADAPLANAPVTVAVGKSSFSATTDADGRYRVDVTAASQADLVRIEATGTGAQATVRLVGFVGSAGEVAAGVDGSGLVTATAAPGLNVSHLSTAVAALLSRPAAGAPTTSSALATALDTVDADATLALATALHLVIDGGQALPAGKADSWALALDAAAVRALRDRWQAEDYDLWYQGYIDALAAAPTSAFAGPSAAPALMVLYAGSSGGEHWQLRPGGTGTATSAAGTSELTWQVQDGQLLLRYATPFASEVYDLLDAATGTYGMVRQEVTGLQVQGLGGPLVKVQQTLRQTALEGAKAGQVIADDVASGWYVQSLATRLDAYPVAAADLPVGTRWAGPVVKEATERFVSLDSDVMEVTAANQVKLAFANETRSLSVADGSFVLKNTAGVEWRYTRLRPADAQGLEAWLVQGRVGTPQAWAEVVPMAPLAKVYTPAAADLARDWVIDVDSGFNSYHLVLRADGTASRGGADATWSLRPDGEVRVVQVYGGGYQRWLQWWPVALADGRLLVLRRIVDTADGTEPSPELAAQVGRYLQAWQASDGS